MADCILREDALQALVDTTEIKGLGYQELEKKLNELPSIAALPQYVEEGKTRHYCNGVVLLNEIDFWKLIRKNREEGQTNDGQTD